MLDTLQQFFTKYLYEDSVLPKIMALVKCSMQTTYIECQWYTELFVFPNDKIYFFLLLFKESHCLNLKFLPKQTSKLYTKLFGNLIGVSTTLQLKPLLYSWLFNCHLDSSGGVLSFIWCSMKYSSRFRFLIKIDEPELQLFSSCLSVWYRENAIQLV